MSYTISWRRCAPYCHLAILCPHLIHVQDELLLMQEMFKSMDLDGAGKIQWEHARLVMAKMGRKLTDDQFAKLVDRYDVDKNGENLYV